jgi:dimethylargininase
MSPFARPSRVIAREVSRSFEGCLRSDTSQPIEIEAARRQHAAYVSLVRSLGITVDVLPADDACPDSCFIEDTAVITGAHGVLTCPGAEPRRAEVGPVGAWLEGRLELHRMMFPATLDGGDVLRIGRWLFVGLSTRTNAEGARYLAGAAAHDGLEIVPLTVGEGLHLKSACSIADGATLVYTPGVIDEDALTSFRAAGLVCVAVPEPAGANVLALGNVVLVSAAAPGTAAVLRERGLDVRILDVSEMHKADGALTCLSLRIPDSAAWST